MQVQTRACCCSHSGNRSESELRSLRHNCSGSNTPSRRITTSLDRREKTSQSISVSPKLRSVRALWLFSLFLCGVRAALLEDVPRFCFHLILLLEDVPRFCFHLILLLEDVPRFCFHLILLRHVYRIVLHRNAGSFILLTYLFSLYFRIL